MLVGKATNRNTENINIIANVTGIILEKLKKRDAVDGLESMMFLFDSNVMKIFYEIRKIKSSVSSALKNELYHELIPQNKIKEAMEEINTMLEKHKFQLLFDTPAEVVKGTYFISISLALTLT